MTWRELLQAGADTLSDAGKPDASHDARQLLLHCFSMDWSTLLLKYEEPVPEERTREMSDFLEYIARRAAGEPLQYLLGTQMFCGLSFSVDERVLIPRYDTEVLAETVLSDFMTERKRGAGTSAAAPKTGFSLLDLCTGSGCIAVALTKLAEGMISRVTATDLSEGALELAAENAAKNGVPGIRFLKGDLFRALESGEHYDIITCNPPYIRSAEIAALDPEVRDHEPRMALDGTEDGLAFYRRLAAEAGRYLNPGGRIYLEIGSDQGAEVKALLEEAGFRNLRIIKDLSGLDRVVCARVPSEKAKEAEKEEAEKEAAKEEEKEGAGSHV